MYILVAPWVARSINDTRSPTYKQDDVEFIRLRTKTHEVMIAPDSEYVLIVMQDQNIEFYGK